MAVSAPRDDNNVPVLMGTSSSDGETPVVLWADPATHRLLTQSSGGGAPADASFVVLSVNASLSDERVLTGTANQITITDNGAGSTVVLSLPQSIATSSTPTFASMTLTGASSLTLGTASTNTGAIILKNSANGNNTTIQAGAAGAALVFTLPTDDGDSGEVLTTNGSGVLSWEPAGGSGTVTSVSVVSANGFAGSVADATTTPAITLTTSITGILSGNGTAISAASTTGSGNVVLATAPSISSPVLTSGTVTTSLVPTSNDGAPLGSTTNQFSDLFLAEGGVINWDNGDLTLTQSGNTLTLSGGELSSSTIRTTSIYQSTGLNIFMDAGEADVDADGNDVRITATPGDPTSASNLAGGSVVLKAGAKRNSGTNGRVKMELGSFSADFSMDSLSADRTITIPDAAGTMTLLGNTSTGSGSVVLATSPQITTSLTTDSTTFSLVNATATTVNFAGAATTLNMAGGSGAVINLGGAANAAELRFLEPSGSGTNYTALKAQAQGANITYTLPATVGAAGTFLTDAAGNGTLSWAAAGGAGAKRRWDTAFETAARFSTDVGGSGAVSVGSQGLTQTTSTTSGSYSRAFAFIGGTTSEQLFNQDPKFGAHVFCDNFDSTTNTVEAFIGLGALTVAGTGITMTGDHMGFYMVIESNVWNLYASVANGATQTKTLITTISDNDELSLYAEVDSGTSITCYYAKNGGAFDAGTTVGTTPPSATTGERSMLFGMSNHSTTGYCGWKVLSAFYERS